MASVEVRSVRKSSALRARGPAKLQATRSMPVDYRRSGAKPAGPAANGVGRRAAAALEEEEDGEAAPAEGDADSPYSSRAATTEEGEESAAEGGAEADSASSAAAAAPRRSSQTASAGPSQRDAKWGDTSSYGAKKVSFYFSFSPLFLFSDTSEMPEFLRIMLEIWSARIVLSTQ
jgi:hypothetical protein